MRVAIRGDDFEDAIVLLENLNVEGAATKIVDVDNAVLLFIKAVSERRGGRFVDEAQNFEAGDAARVFWGLPLGIGEIGGHRDDSLCDLRSEETLGVALELAEDQSRNFRRSVGFVAECDA